jgi:hypothetical protein
MSESLAVYFLKYGMRKERAGWVGIAHVNEMPGGMGAGVVQRQVEVTGQGTCKRVLHFMAPRIHSLFIFNFDSFHSSFLWVLLFAIPFFLRISSQNCKYSLSFVLTLQSTK